MQGDRRHYLLQVVVVGVVLWGALYYAAIAQKVADWTVKAPPNTVQLVGVKAVAGGGLQFLFKNVSGKTIVAFRVASPEFNGSSTEKGFDAYLTLTGEGRAMPGTTMSANFDEKDFSSGNQTDRTLRVEAVVFGDRSWVGSSKGMDAVEDEMLGIALEAERDAEILEQRKGGVQDQGTVNGAAQGLVSAAAKIGKTMALPATALEIAAIRGLGLPGVPQSYIDARVNRPGSNVALGVNLARAYVLAKIEDKRSYPFRPGPDLEVKQATPSLSMPPVVESADAMAMEIRALANMQLAVVNSSLNSSSAP